MSDYHDDPDEKVTVVCWTENDHEDPFPLFAVETQDAGIEAARRLRDEHGGRSRWITIPLQRVNQDEVGDLIPDAEAADE